MKTIFCFLTKPLFLGSFCTMLGIALFSLSAMAGSSAGLPRRLSEDQYTADPSAHVFDGKIYIYPSHDIPHEDMGSDDGNEYQMEDYHVFSMDDPADLCTDHGEVLNVKDVPWASCQMWAPDAAYKDGTYYLYFPMINAQAGRIVHGEYMVIFHLVFISIIRAHIFVRNIM